MTDAQLIWGLALLILVGTFGAAYLTADLSTGRVLRRQILRMFDHHANPALPTDFD